MAALIGAGARRRRRWAGGLAGMLLALMVGRGVAQAHAQLARSDPAADAIVEAAPARATLWFTEQPDPQFSEVQVLDQARRRIDRGDLRVESADRLGLSVGLADPAPGTYAVLWKVLSTVDGHVTRGAFAFTVGLDQPPSAGSPLPEQTGATATPDQVVPRVLGYLGLAALLGAFPFVGLILLPATALGAATAGTRALLLRRSWALAAAGAAIGLGASVASLVTQAAAAFDLPFAQAFGGPALAITLGSRSGLLWWTRVALLAALGASAVWLGCGGASPRVRPTVLLAGSGLGLALLLAQALGSHAAAVAGTTATAVALDWLHLVAVVVWVGGLAHLALALWQLGRSPHPGEGTRVAARLVSRFSTLAIVCVGTLLLTGFYQSWLHVGSVPAVVGTAYGQALLVKLALTTPLIALGAVNLLVLGPRLRDPTRGQVESSRLRRTVAAEILVSLGVFTVAGVLASLEPGRAAFQARGIEQRAAAEGLRATLRVQPGVAGPNRFDVQILDLAGRPVTDAEKVAFRFTMPTMDHGESEVVAYHRDAGHYVAQGGPLVMEGPWRIEAVIRRPGREDVRPAFETVVGAPAEDAAPRAAPPVAEGTLILGVELLIAGASCLIFALWATPRRRRAFTIAFPITVVAVVAGSLMAGSGAATLSGAARAPIAPTTESTARGRAIYVERCAVCHGDAGRGDGPAAPGLFPRPADFRVHMAAGHTRSQLLDWITNGVAGTAMPAFRNDLSEEDRWHVLNFIQSTFGPGSPPPAT